MKIIELLEYYFVDFQKVRLHRDFLKRRTNSGDSLMPYFDLGLAPIIPRTTGTALKPSRTIELEKCTIELKKARVRVFQRFSHTARGIRTNLPNRFVAKRPKEPQKLRSWSTSMANSQN